MHLNCLIRVSINVDTKRLFLCTDSTRPAAILQYFFFFTCFYNIIIVYQIDKGHSNSGEKGWIGRLLNKFQAVRTAIGWWITLVASKRWEQTLSSRLLWTLSRGVIGRRTCHSSVPRLGCSAPLKRSIDGRIGLCSERRYPYVFHCSKTKPCSVLVIPLLVAGFPATPLLELSCFFSLRAVTSGLDDAIAAF